MAWRASKPLQKDLNLKAAVADGDTGKIKDWLGENVHKYGAIYSPKDLQKRAFGETYNPQWLIKSLQEKYVT